MLPLWVFDVFIQCTHTKICRGGFWGQFFPGRFLGRTAPETAPAIFLGCFLGCPPQKTPQKICPQKKPHQIYLNTTTPCQLEILTFKATLSRLRHTLPSYSLPIIVYFSIIPPPSLLAWASPRLGQWLAMAGPALGWPRAGPAMRGIVPARTLPKQGAWGLCLLLQCCNKQQSNQLQTSWDCGNRRALCRMRADQKMQKMFFGFFVQTDDLLCGPDGLELPQNTRLQHKTVFCGGILCYMAALCQL